MSVTYNRRRCVDRHTGFWLVLRWQADGDRSRHCQFLTLSDEET